MLGFWWRLYWISKLILVRWPFYYVNTTDPWGWEIFLSSVIFSSLFFQTLEVLVIQVFYLLEYSYTEIYYYYLWLLWRMLFPWFLSQPLYHLIIGRLLIFLKLILYPTTSLRVLITYRCFLAPYVYTVISSATSESLTSSFLCCIPWSSFSCLIAPARTSSALLHRYRESEQPCLVSDFRGNALSFSPFNLVLAIGLLNITFIVWACPLYPWSLQGFYHEGVLDFVKGFSVWD